MKTRNLATKRPTKRKNIFEPYVQVEIRRELVDALDSMGVKHGAILIELQKRGYLKGYKNPYNAVKEDLMYIHARRREARQQDIDSIRAEYIARNTEILKRALEGPQGDFHSALEACKNIARTKGLDVDEVLKFKGAVLNVNTELSDSEISRRIQEIENILTRTEARAIKKKNIRK